MYRGTHFIIWIGLLVLPGCFSRSGGGPFGTNARVPAPGTYQLKIPSLASQAPYYTPNQNSQVASNPAATINPNAAAPTLNVASRDLQGWKLVNGQAAPASNAPVYQSPNVVGAGATIAQPNFQVASNSTLTRPGTSGSGNNLAAQTNSQPLDSTRMAAIDASSIRPPSTTVLGPNSLVQPPTMNQPAAQAPPQYFGNLQPGGGNSSGATTGFTQPNLTNRYAAQPVVGVPGSYQSPYIRNTGTFAQGPELRSGAPGWVARESSGTNR